MAKKISKAEYEKTLQWLEQRNKAEAFVERILNDPPSTADTRELIERSLRKRRHGA